MFATGIVKSNLAEYKDKLVIPASAVLWTGKRSVVYVKQAGDEAIFHLREIELGPKLGESYVITDGLSDGEEIVTQGAFSVDAAAQLEGKPSMMNQEGNTVSTGHNSWSESEFRPNECREPTMLQFKVSGNCDMCKERIETAAKSVSGVASAEWDVESKIMKVNFDGAKTNSDNIQKAISHGWT